jgi:hypothetical protein
MPFAFATGRMRRFVRFAHANSGGNRTLMVAGHLIGNLACGRIVRLSSSQ